MNGVGGFLLGLGVFVGVGIACRGQPRKGVRFFGWSFLFVGSPVMFATFVSMLACGEIANAFYWYFPTLLQYLALSYAFIVDERMWHPAVFFCGCVSMLAFIITFIASGELEITNAILGGGCILFVAYFYVLRRYALKKAFNDLKPDRARYDAVWNGIKEKQISELVAVTAIVNMHDQRKKRQPEMDLESLFDLAESVNGWFQQVVDTWTAFLKVGHKAAPLKKLDRVLQKTERSYSGDHLRVLDFVRSTVIVDTAAEAKHVLEFVMKQVTVHTIKNRYNPDYSGEETAGYRDINMQLSFEDMKGRIEDGERLDGFVFELQIIMSGFLAIKSNEGHKRYILCRNLRGD